MATFLWKLGLNLTSFKYSNSGLMINSVRCAHGWTRNPKGGKNKRKRGIKTPDGTEVHRGQFLAGQIGLLFHPGENVELVRGRLYALQDGKVMITCEKIRPNWNIGIVQSCYENSYEIDKIEKTFIHVIPLPQPKKFRLIDQI